MLSFLPRNAFRFRLAMRRVNDELGTMLFALVLLSPNRKFTVSLPPVKATELM